MMEVRIEEEEEDCERVAVADVVASAKVGQ